MIDFFLCPMHMLNWHYESKHRCGKWNMQSDHRTIHFRLPETTNQKKKQRWTPPRKREVSDPREFGERAERTVSDTEPGNMHSLDKCFADIASAMKEKTPRRRIAHDPRIKELIMKRVALPRSHDGRERFKITEEIRTIIRADTRKKKKEAVKEAFARHTNWAKTANELRINRPQAAPVFSIEGRSTTSDEEAIEAIARHIGKIYSEPEQPIDIPPWNPNHGVGVLSLEKVVGLAVLSAKKGKASDTSGLSNACIKSLGEGTISRIANIIRDNGERQEGFPIRWKKSRGLLLHKKRRSRPALQLQTLRYSPNNGNILRRNIQPSVAADLRVPLRARTAWI